MAKVIDNEINLAQCRCIDCPTHNECAKAKDERLFCRRGIGFCAYKNNGCICPGCVVYRNNKLKYNYYCKKNFNE